MGFFVCCFSGNESAEHKEQPSIVRPTVAFREDNLSGYPDETDWGKLNEPLTLQSWQESACKDVKDVANGLQCALMLQASLCAAGSPQRSSQANARFLVDTFKERLRASSVRLYVLSVGHTADGSMQTGDGNLVQLASAHCTRTGLEESDPDGAYIGSTGQGARDAFAGEPVPGHPSHSSYLCPKHEPVGSSSMLIRQALVSKVSVMFQCGPRAAATSLRPGPTHGPVPSCRATSFGSIATPVVSRPSGNASASSVTMHSFLDAATTAASFRACCPNLDLTEADAVPGSAMAFAALPLMYGMTTFGVLWIAAPFQADLSDTSMVGTAAVNDRADSPVPSSVPPLLSPYRAPRPQSHVRPLSTSSDFGRSGSAVRCTKTSGSGHPRPAIEVFGSPLALEILATSAAMHLAAAGGANAVQVRCLGATLSYLAESATLADLILELSSAIIRHVRQRFYVDATAHVVLVPTPDSFVGFMLRPERGSEGAPLEGPSNGSSLHSRRPALPLTPSRLRLSTIPMCQEVSTGVTTMPFPSSVAALKDIHCSRNGMQVTHAAAASSPRAMTTATSSASNAGPTVVVNAATVVSSVSAHEAPASRPVSRDTHLSYTTPKQAESFSVLRGSVVQRDVFMVDSGVARSEGSFAMLSSCCGSGSGAGGAPLPSMSSRAFKLSNTLLQAMMTNSAHIARQKVGGGSKKLAPVTVLVKAPGSTDEGVFEDGATAPPSIATAISADTAAAGGNGGVLTGICVRDCARHVQDERQPSRDVCMLMMSAGIPATTIAVGSSCLPRSRTSPLSMVASESPMAFVTPECGASSSGGAQSLVLLGMEMGDGAVLAVYLAFPTPTPIQLLEAVREDCNSLLREHLAPLLRHRLRCTDLAAEWETLRAGVPGSYLSVSRGSVVHRDSHGASTLHNSSVRSQPPSRHSMAMSPGSSAGPGRAAAAVGTRGNSHLPLSLFASSQGKGQGTGGGLVSPLLEKRIVTGAVAAALGSGEGVLRSEASLVSLAPGMGSGPQGVVGGGGAPENGGNLLLPLGLNRSKSLTHGGMVEDEGISFREPSLLQPSALCSPNAHKAALAPAAVCSRSFRRLMSGFKSGKKAATTGGIDTTTAELPAANSTWEFQASPVHNSSGCFADGCSSAMGQLAVEADEEGHSACFDCTSVRGEGGEEGKGGELAATGFLTVHDLDETYESWGMRAHVGALVDSILSTTLRSSGPHAQLDDVGRGGMTPAPYITAAARRNTEGLEELQLSAVLGQGASGVVLKGTLGCTPVAVKIMEMPDADDHVNGLVAALDAGGGAGGDGGIVGNDKDGNGGGWGFQAPPARTATKAHDGGCAMAMAAELQEVRARRALLRNAMEVALMRSISHVNIVQAYAVYDNVIMERHSSHHGSISLRRVRHPKDAATQEVPDVNNPGNLCSSPICTAIVLQLCDRGSLADVLQNRSFPALPAPPPPPLAHVAPRPAAHHTGGGVASLQYARYWRGVYMTLLEVALALRHLHSRRLVHRDVKPGNILLKSSPGDPRGWTCKLADFGFVLVLDQRDDHQQQQVRSCGEEVGMGPRRSRGEDSTAAGTSPLLSPRYSNLQQQLAGSGQPPAIPAAGVVGGARDWFAVQQEIGGTVTHMAPESFKKGGRINAAVDVYSFGIIMWEITCSRGQRPYSGRTASTWTTSARQSLLEADPCSHRGTMFRRRTGNWPGPVGQQTHGSVQPRRSWSWPLRASSPASGCDSTRALAHSLHRQQSSGRSGEMNRMSVGGREPRDSFKLRSGGNGESEGRGLEESWKKWPVHYGVRSR